MPLNYTHVEVYTDEEAKYDKKPLHDAIVNHVHLQKAAIRCIVTKGCGGCYEGGEVVTQNILALSMKMPVKIDIIGPERSVTPILPQLEEMVADGIILIHTKEVYCHKSRKQLLPKSMSVKDIMTPSPQTLSPTQKVRDILDLLLNAPFNGLPVIDVDNKPVGMVTSHDLMQKANLPIRIGLLAVSDKEAIHQMVCELDDKTAQEIMSSPVISLQEDTKVTDAVQLMIKKSIKRLPVVNESGKIVGMLSRLDMFKTISQNAPIWKNMACQQVNISNIKTVSDIMQRDSRTVSPETQVEQALKIIAKDNIQRLPVVDEKNHFIGLISDRDLLYAFLDKKGKLWQFIAGRLFTFEKTHAAKNLGIDLRNKTVFDIMQTDLITVQEETPIEEVIQIMTEKGLKRLPVLDKEGKYKGLVSRMALLKGGIS